MAVFEKEFHRRKVYLDDTQPLYCSFVNVQNIQGHTVSHFRETLMTLMSIKGHVFNSLYFNFYYLRVEVLTCYK